MDIDKEIYLLNLQNKLLIAFECFLSKSINLTQDRFKNILNLLKKKYENTDNIRIINRLLEIQYLKMNKNDEISNTLQCVLSSNSNNIFLLEDLLRCVDATIL
jgi:hypothetical protein